MKQNKIYSLSTLFIFVLCLAMTIYLNIINVDLLGFNILLYAIPFLQLLVLLTSIIYPYFKPKMEEKQNNSLAPILLNSVLTIMQLIIMLDAINVNIDAWKISIIGFGFLVSLAGNYFPKSKMNNLFAIYNPWTIINKSIWRKTHRFAGYVWVFGGISIILTSFLSNAINLWITLGISVILLLSPTIFSMLYFKFKVYKNG